MSNQRALRSIDLFSGIGGMALALHGIATPLVYCDIAPRAQDTLKRLMARKLLPAAPVLGDVRLVSARKLPPLADHEDAVIVAGFPCVGFSTMGRQKAFQNEESALFSEVLRIIDSFPASRAPPLVFLENVPNVLRIGMREIVAQLAVARGYELRWCTVSAESVGAPHVRNRWFCLAVRPGYEFAFGTVLQDAYHPYTWTRAAAEAVPRTVGSRGLAGTHHASPSEAAERCGLLGNSVVPDAVRVAFCFLARRCEHGADPLSLAPGERLAPAADPCGGNGGADVPRPGPAAFPRAGIILAGTDLVEARLCPGRLRECEVDGPTMSPDAFAPPRPPSPLLRTPLVRKLTRFQAWSTPRHSITGACNYLTERSIRDLPTQVRFEVRTEARDMPVAAEFVEFLMGFPIGWTRLVGPA